MARNQLPSPLKPSACGSHPTPLRLTENIGSELSLAGNFQTARASPEPPVSMLPDGEKPSAYTSSETPLRCTTPPGGRRLQSITTPLRAPEAKREPEASKRNWSNPSPCFPSLREAPLVTSRSQMLPSSAPA